MQHFSVHNSMVPVLLFVCFVNNMVSEPVLLFVCFVNNTVSEPVLPIVL